MPLPSHRVGAEDFLRSAGKQILEQIHHVIEVRICLVEFHRSKFRVMAGIHTFVAEDSPHFIDAFHAADDQPFQIKLRGDAQIHVKVKRIVVSNKRSGGCTSGNGVQHGSLNFQVTAPVQEATEIRDKAGTNLKVAAAFIAHDEVYIALTIPEFGIGHTVELLGKRTQ